MKTIEVLVSYEPAMLFFRMVKQLFGESEGKEGRGIFPHLYNLQGLAFNGQYPRGAKIFSDYPIL